MVSTRTPQIVPVMSETLGLRAASAKKPSKDVPSARWRARVASSKPVSQRMTSSSSSCVRPFFWTFAR